MNVFVFDTVDEASKKAYEIFREAKDKGAKVFGLATGSTPEKLYEYLVDSDVDFTDSIAINLDEYYGLPADHPQSYAYFMKKHLFDKKPFKETYIENGLNEDVEAEVARYTDIIKKHPIDLQILGIGPNGHIGFNEPGSPFDGQTHLADLTDTTIEANSRFFDDKKDVPTKAYSMGIGEILESKQIILMAFGENKADAVHELVEGKVTNDVPATVLQTHPNVTVIVDKTAGSKLEKEY